MNKAVLFDLDGTLLNTSLDLRNALNYALRNSGAKEVTVEDVLLRTGHGIKNLVEVSIPNGLNNPAFNQAYEDFKEYYKENCTNDTYMYPEVVETIRKIKNRGYKVAVISNKADFLTQKIIKFYFNDLFDVITGARDDMRLKPAPDLCEFVLKELDVAKNNAFYVGDSYTDYETATNSNLRPLIVTYGFKSKEFLINKGVKVLLDSVKELLEYVR